MCAGKCVREGSSHESVILGYTWEGTRDVSEILGAREVLVDELEIGLIEVGLMPTNL